MKADKPGWIRHDGMQIFSIDVQPGGLRFATGGGDYKVRIWNMKSVGGGLGAEDVVPKLLATVRDHFGSVNCVRWAKHSRYVASGSDDQVILIHERKPGKGTTEFGSGEPPDVENWKVSMTLRGHTADVVDLNWSPDDSLLASASLDNTIHIWDMSNGTCIAVLRGHSSLVKGVAWDPIGSFIASQSDDKTVIIWRTSDWSLAHRTDGHWAKSLGSTFFRRLGWSPCGHFITTTHGFQKPRHSAPVLERGEWSATFDFLGHNAPIIVVKFNHSMFRRNVSNSQDSKISPHGWENGTAKTGGKDSQPYNIIAIGSQDRTITVWTTASPRPLFVAKHFFAQSVVDLSWSPNGYSLFACSLDGTVAIFNFDANDFGQKITDADLDEFKKSRYGDVRGRQVNLAESPAQLQLEAAAAVSKQIPGKRLIQEGIRKQASKKSSPALGPSTKLPKSQISDVQKSQGAAGDGLIKSAPRISSPVKQREYRRPDGRKRIIPEAVGVPVQSENISGNVHSQSLDFAMPSDHRREENGMVHVDAGIKEASVRKTATGISDFKERSSTSARASVSESLVIEKVPVSAEKNGGINIEQRGLLQNQGSLNPANNMSIRVFDKREGEDSLPVCLEAHPREHAISDILGTGSTTVMRDTEIVCKRGTRSLWSDRISGKVTVLAGNSNFWAVGCEDGSLQVYTKCGRRAMPMMMMGSAAVFIDCDEAWKLLLVTKKGSLHVWDLFDRKCILNDSLASLVSLDFQSTPKDAGAIKVISAKFSKSGFPLVVLATRHAYLFDTGLMCWLRVADDCFPASNFASSWNLGSVHGGELASMQVDVRKFLARKPGWSRVTDDGVQTRAHLETQLASALALKSANEYRQCLLSYIRFLAREADESRLREICESFLGPPTGMNENRSIDVKQSWDKYVLGMEKHKLLKDDILPAMAANRKVQRLLNEFMDLLSEYEIGEMNTTEKNPGPLTSQAAEDNMNCDTHTNEEPITTPPVVDEILLLLPASVEQNGDALQSKDSLSQVRKQMDVDQQPADQSELLTVSTDQAVLDASVLEKPDLASQQEEVPQVTSV